MRETFGKRLAIMLPVVIICATVLVLMTVEPSHAVISTTPSAITPIPVTAGDEFIFVQGCVPIPSAGTSCANPPEIDWHNHLDFLRDLLQIQELQFQSWLPQHVAFVHATNAQPSPLAEAVRNLPARSGKIYLIGHSAGGKAIVNYLLDLKPAGTKTRIGGAVILDSPVARENLVQLTAGAWAGFDNVERLNGLGAWAKAVNIPLLLVSYEDDWAINPLSQVGDIPALVIRRNPAFRAGTWELMLKHNYFILDRNGARDLLSNIFQNRP